MIIKGIKLLSRLVKKKHYIIVILKMIIKVYKERILSCRNL